jgi:acyl-CoA thioesterase-2
MSSLLRAFALTQEAAGRFRAVNVPSDHRPVVFGGQLVGQLGLAAAATVGAGKAIRSVHAVFARAGAVAQDLSVDADPVHDGRTLSSVAVRIRQDDRQICAGLVLLDGGDADVVTHAAAMPPVSGPEDAVAVPGEPGSEVRVVGGPAIWSASEVGPAEAHVWVRFPCAAEVTDDGVHRALAAWYTDGFLIGAAMRPHPIGIGMAHEAVSTGVLTHTVTFHATPDATRWLLITQTSTHAGGGRCYGTGAVYTDEGTLVASFAQTAMIRAFPATQQARGAATMAM